MATQSQLAALRKTEVRRAKAHKALDVAARKAAAARGTADHARLQREYHKANTARRKADEAWNAAYSAAHCSGRIAVAI